MDLLRQHLKQSVGFNEATDDVFIARKTAHRSLNKGHEFVDSALNQLTDSRAFELVAEDLRQAQMSLRKLPELYPLMIYWGRFFPVLYREVNR